MQGRFQTNSNNVTATDLEQRRQERRGAAPDPTERCKVFSFPGSGDRLASELTEVNARFFLTVSELHRVMLDKLLHIPRNFLDAAESLVTVPDGGEHAELWEKTLTLHAETLGYSRGPVMEIARLHNLREQGRQAVEAIRVIESTLPCYLRAVARKSVDAAALPGAATLLGSALSILDGNLTDLHATVRLSIERANSLIAASGAGSPPGRP